MLGNTRKSLRVGWRQRAVIPAALQDLGSISEGLRLSLRLLPTGAEKL